MRKSIAFIGVGNMGSAILNGILQSGMFSADQIILCDADSAKCAAFCAQGCVFETSPVMAVQRADSVLLAVKPQQIDALMQQIAPCISGKLILSIAAGTTLSHLEDSLPGASVVRIMPNTPLQVKNGVSAVCCGSSVSDEDSALAFRIFAASGMAVRLPESLLNPVTALTSSSIAYFARFIGEMCSWAKENGFSDEEEILRMVCHSAIGTAKMLLETQHTPESLEKAVTSPNGTTEKAMAVFHEKNLHEMLYAAMNACRDRADELSGK